MPGSIPALNPGIFEKNERKNGSQIGHTKRKHLKRRVITLVQGINVNISKTQRVVENACINEMMG